MLVMQCTKEPSELTINLDDATIQKEYNGEIQAKSTFLRALSNDLKAHELIADKIFTII